MYLLHQYLHYEHNTTHTRRYEYNTSHILFLSFRSLIIPFTQTCQLALLFFFFLSQMQSRDNLHNTMDSNQNKSLHNIVHNTTDLARNYNIDNTLCEHNNNNRNNLAMDYVLWYEQQQVQLHLESIYPMSILIDDLLFQLFCSQHNPLLVQQLHLLIKF